MYLLSSTKCVPKRFVETKKKAMFNSRQGVMVSFPLTQIGIANVPVQCVGKPGKKGGSEAQVPGSFPSGNPTRDCTTSHSKLLVKVSHKEGVRPFLTHHGVLQ